jgi:competence protein ComEC
MGKKRKASTNNRKKTFVSKAKKALLCLLALLLLSVLAYVVFKFLPSVRKSDASVYREMEVHFIDVGQGDSTLIIVGDKAMLIDTGDDTKGVLIQDYLNKRRIERIDYLILTHPDSDHIGGAPTIITQLEVDRVFVSNFEKDNLTYMKLIEALDNKQYAYNTPQVGDVYELGEARFMILAPNAEYPDPNNSSIALLLTHGANTFLFTGDAEEIAEIDIVANGYPISVDVLHAGHHGSRTSSSEAFMNVVMPEYAVISCDEGNSYGHPHAQTMNTYRSMGIKVFRTDEQGSIVATSNGKSITWNCTPSETWQQGEPKGTQ